MELPATGGLEDYIFSYLPFQSGDFQLPCQFSGKLLFFFKDPCLQPFGYSSVRFTYHSGGDSP